jgi:hypothetical protein
MPSGTPPNPEPLPSVVDETGLVTSCLIPDVVLPDDLPTPIGVANAFEDSRVHVEWVGRPCDGAMAFTFRALSSGFALEGLRSDEECSGSNVGFRIQITFSRPMPASGVTATLSDLSATGRVCPDESRSVDGGVIVVDDEIGLISSCEAQTDRGLPTGEISVSRGDGGQLRVAWPVVLDNCTPMNTRLQLWRDPHPVSSLGTGYVLAIRMSSPNALPPDPLGPMCDIATGMHTATLQLAEPIDPADIHVFQTVESADHIGSSTWVEALDGFFELSLSVRRGALIANEPLDELSAALTYQGERRDLVVYEGGLPELSWSQLDGDLTFHPYGHLLICRNSSTDLGPDGRVESTFVRPNEPAAGDPNNAFYDEFMDDGKFRLPAGTYLVTAGTSFFSEPNCGGERTRLTTSIVIEVL